jgi:hypothetical protein
MHGFDNGKRGSVVDLDMYAYSFVINTGQTPS